MLQSEPGNLLVVRPEDVIAFRGHAQTIPPARIFPRRIFVCCGNGGEDRIVAAKRRPIRAVLLAARPRSAAPV
jgi:hypothetical protein